MVMRVEFFKRDGGRLCTWVAHPPKRRAFEGSTMASGRDLPHDLAQFTIERALGIRDGFWGLLAHGASFASVPGRRPTHPGRALVAAHHSALIAVEGVVNGHYLAWQRGEPTPLRGALDAMYARWLAVSVEEPLSLEWPIEPLGATALSRGDQRRPARRGRPAGRRARGPA